MIVKANQHETDEDGEMEPEAVEGGGNSRMSIGTWPTGSSSNWTRKRAQLLLQG